MNHSSTLRLLRNGNLILLAIVAVLCLLLTGGGGGRLVPWFLGYYVTGTPVSSVELSGQSCEYGHKRSSGMSSRWNGTLGSHSSTVTW